MSEILREEFMNPHGISTRCLANDIGVSVSRIQAILQDRRKNTADISMRLGRYFGVGESFFLDLQSDIDIRNARPLIRNDLLKIRPIAA